MKFHLNPSETRKTLRLSSLKLENSVTTFQKQAILISQKTLSVNITTTLCHSALSLYPYTL